MSAVFFRRFVFLASAIRTPYVLAGGGVREKVIGFRGLGIEEERRGATLRFLAPLAQLSFLSSRAEMRSAFVLY